VTKEGSEPPSSPERGGSEAGSVAASRVQHEQPTACRDGSSVDVSSSARAFAHRVDNTAAAADLILHSHILASLGEGVQLARAADGRLIYANPAFERMFGYEAGELVGQPLSVLNAPDTTPPEETVQQIIGALDRDGRWEGDILNRRKDGSTFHCHATVTETLHPQHGRVWISVHQDLSRRIAAERERETLLRKLMDSQRMESLGIMAGGIAHDINNYLVLIMGSASLLGGTIAIDPGQEEVVRQIQIGARHIRDLVQQMLAFSGKGRIATQAISMAELLSELLPLLRASVSKKVRLLCDFGENLPSVDGDPAQLRQVLLNTIVNSSEALAGGVGTIRISLHPYVASDALRLPGETQSGLIIEIADTGPGIPGEILSRIFEPFFSTKMTGRGLGLAAVLGIVRSHHGAISAQAPSQGGALFRIALPAGRLPPPCSPQKSPRALAEARGRSVLVVDDEPGVRTVLQLFLQRSGYPTLLAESGAQALQLLQESQGSIGVVLLDLTMPDRSGEEVFQDIRQIDPQLPVIIMSGYNAKAALPPELLADLAGLLTKPFEKADLLQLLQQVLKPQASVPTS
jgi:two-component system cell cycle sensor histidine kinase/response regulator CckA